MKITKRQLVRIIKEEKQKLFKEEIMSGKNATAIQLLQTVHVNLDEISSGLDDEAYIEISTQMVLIEDAIIALGGILP